MPAYAFAWPDLVDVSAQVSFPSPAQVILPFTPNSIMISLEDDPSVLRGCVVSFDGSTAAGFLLTGVPQQSQTWNPAGYRNIYFKRYGALGAQKIRIQVQ
jgi:hypothetical protein